MNPEQATARKPWIVRARSWVSMVIIAPFAIFAAFSTPSVREESVADFLLGAAGWACFFIGALFRWWATLYVGGKKDRELIVDGPYSVCRNPLYLGTFLLTLSIAFIIHSRTFAIGLLIATPLYLWVTVPWEEARLQKVFGKRYDEYRARVPKFIPTLSTFQSPPTIAVSMRGLWGEFRIASRWIWIPLLAEAFAHLRMESWWPDILRLP